MPSNKSKITNFIYPLLLCIITFEIATLFARIGVDPHHDGIMFKPAVDLVEGQIPFKQTLIQYGPVTTGLQALAVSIFGKFLLVLRMQTVFFYVFIVALSWLIWRRFLPRYLAVITILIWLSFAPFMSFMFQPWSSVYALFFQLLAGYLLIRFIESRQNVFLFISGLATALVFLCRQPVGMLTFGALLVFLFLLSKDKTLSARFRNTGFYLTGVIAIILTFFLFLVITGSLTDWWLQTFYFPSIWVRGIKGISKVAMLRHLFPFKLNYLIWAILPIITIFLFLNSLRSKSTNKQENMKLQVMLLIALASWHQYSPVNDHRHLFWAATPMFGLFAYYFLQLNGSVSKFIKINQKNQQFSYALYAVDLVIIVLLFSPIIENVSNGIEKLSQPYVTIKVPSALKGMRVSKAEAVDYEAIDKALKKYLARKPKSKLITTGGDALYLSFIPNNHNFHPTYIYYPIYPGYEKKINDFIKKEKPIIIVYVDWKPEGYIAILKTKYLSLVAPKLH